MSNKPEMTPEEIADLAAYELASEIHPIASICIILLAIIILAVATVYIFERDAYCDELKMQEQQMMIMESQND